MQEPVADNSTPAKEPPRESFLLKALEPISNEVESVQEALFDLMPSESQTTKNLLEHVLSSKGKLIRPALFFYCCKMVGYDGDHKISIGAVCEYVHVASLLHDDVIDNSSLRRNKPTANTIWGDEASVLVGDLIYSRASELMAQSGSLDLVETFARAIRLMSEGELLQLENIYNLEITPDSYYRILENKTAVLISACCKAAGLLAQKSDEVISALEQFGRNVGIAFQLVDDSLDYASDESRLGKPSLNDLREGKVTLPIIKLRDVATKEQWSQLLIHCNESIDEKAIGYANELVSRYKTVESTLAEAREYSDKAIDALSVIPDSAFKTDLIALTQHLVWRKV